MTNEELQFLLTFAEGTGFSLTTLVMGWTAFEVRKLRVCVSGFRGVPRVIHTEPTPVVDMKERGHA